MEKIQQALQWYVQILLGFRVNMIGSVCVSACECMCMSVYVIRMLHVIRRMNVGFR